MTIIGKIEEMTENCLINFANFSGANAFLKLEHVSNTHRNQDHNSRCVYKNVRVFFQKEMCQMKMYLTVNIVILLGLKMHFF